MLFKLKKPFIKIKHMNKNLINCSYQIQPVVSHKLLKASYDW